MEYDSEGYELQTYRVEWYAELGWVDGGGIGYWEGTDVSVKCKSKEEAESVRDKWVESGKLTLTNFGEYRPLYPYGAFRIRGEIVRV